MFSKALFKQSCKANRVMWCIVTFFVCFILACVMLISGGGSIGEARYAIQDTIIEGEVDASLEKRALSYYKISKDGMYDFDELYKTNFIQIKQANGAALMTELVTYDAKFNAYLSGSSEMPEATTDAEKLYLKNYTTWANSEPVAENFESYEAFNAAHAIWEAQKPVGELGIKNAMVSYLGAAAYKKSIDDLQAKVLEDTKLAFPKKTITADSQEYKERLGAVMFAINPNGMFNNNYTGHEEQVPADYDVTSIIKNIENADYLKSDERLSYIEARSENSACIFIAHNMTEKTNVDLLLKELAKYGVDEEKYKTFGYDYSGIKHIAKTVIVSYQARFDYEKAELDKATYENAKAYDTAVVKMDDELTSSLTQSLLESLPGEVSDALEEVGQLDLYSLIVGSIFYKMAGLLLPIIFMIMVSNNLIAGQVDSGSMAYILSTSTKREQVTFTQAVYLAGSLFAMFVCTTITSVVCLAIVQKPEISLDYGQIILLNLGAFITIFAMSGICFCASCWFDRSKRSMAIGGGLSMFFLVATMLGLFGSPVLPSIVRLETLNMFNYVSIISLFDVISIIDKTTAFIWKFVILIAIGLAGYIIGSVKFKKKDLPL